MQVITSLADSDCDIIAGAKSKKERILANVDLEAGFLHSRLAQWQLREGSGGSQQTTVDQFTCLGGSTSALLPDSFSSPPPCRKQTMYFDDEMQ